jgi:hypothetical protein
MATLHWSWSEAIGLFTQKSAISDDPHATSNAHSEEIRLEVPEANHTRHFQRTS